MNLPLLESFTASQLRSVLPFNFLPRWTAPTDPTKWFQSLENLRVIRTNELVCIARPLAWDSDFFAKSMWKLELIGVTLQGTHIDHGNLNDTLKNLGAHHCITIVDASQTEILRCLEELGWECVENRAQFFIELNQFNVSQPFPTIPATEQDSIALAEVAANAINPSDRFRRDSFFEKTQIDSLMKLWVKKSIDGTLADTILRPADEPYAFMATKSYLQEGSSKLNITKAVLLASSRSGEGIFQKLTEQTLQVSYDLGMDYYTLATQHDNKAALRSCIKIGMQEGPPQKVYRKTL